MIRGGLEQKGLEQMSTWQGVVRVFVGMGEWGSRIRVYRVLPIYRRKEYLQDDEVEGWA